MPPLLPTPRSGSAMPARPAAAQRLPGARLSANRSREVARQRGGHLARPAADLLPVAEVAHRRRGQPHDEPID
jgi:hypothetical protein